MCWNEHMGFVLVLVVWGLGLLAFTVSLQKLIAANPGHTIPQFFGRPPNNPGGVYLLRMVGVALLLVSAFLASETLGYWSVVPILIAGIPPVVLTARHNRAVEGRGAGE